MPNDLVVVGAYPGYEEALPVVEALRAQGIRAAAVRGRAARESISGNDGHLIEVLVEDTYERVARDVVEALAPPPPSGGFDDDEIRAWRAAAAERELRAQRRTRAWTVGCLYALAVVFVIVGVAFALVAISAR